MSTQSELKINTFTSKWCGREGTMVIYRYGKSTGLRVTVMTWADSPEKSQVRLVEGDGRRPDYVLHHEETVDTAKAGSLAYDLLHR